MSDLRKPDEKEIIQTLKVLSGKTILCDVEKCDKEATAIVEKSPLCSDHGEAYLNRKMA